MSSARGASASSRPRTWRHPCARSPSTASYLVGNDRVRKADAWPLTVSMALPEGSGWDQSRTWTLVAGGDSFTDRGVYDTVVNRGKGIDYPFDGGTARVTGHGCCDPVFDGNAVPRYKLTGPKGVVRGLFKDADLAIVNHEMPDHRTTGVSTSTASSSPASRS